MAACIWLCIFKAFLIGLVQKGPLCWEPRAGKCPFKAWSRSGYIAMQCLLQPLFTSFKKYVFKSLHFMYIMIQVHLLFCHSTPGMAGWVLCISCFYHSSQHQVAAWQAYKNSVIVYVHFSIHFSQSSFWKACKRCGCESQFTFVTLLHMRSRCVFFEWREVFQWKKKYTIWDWDTFYEKILTGIRKTQPAKWAIILSTRTSKCTTFSGKCHGPWSEKDRGKWPSQSKNKIDL